MKAETEPVSDDEFVLRLIWDDYFTAGLPISIQRGASEPRASEPEGISVFREACLQSPADTLAVISPNKQSRYFVARLCVSDLLPLGLSIKPEPISEVPGHAVIPELNAVAYQANRPFWRIVQKQLAQLASRDVVYRPATGP